MKEGIGNIGVRVVKLVVKMVIKEGILGKIGGKKEMVEKEDGEEKIWIKKEGLILVKLIIVKDLEKWLGMKEIEYEKD